MLLQNIKKIMSIGTGIAIPDASGGQFRNIKLPESGKNPSLIMF